MRLLVAAVLVAALAAGTGWAAVEADAADPTAAPADARSTTPVLSVRRTPEVLLATRRDDAVVAAVESIPPRIGGESCLVVAEGGRELLAHGATTPLIPASTQKVLVATAMLDVMGKDETFRTTAVATAPPAEGIVGGDLVVVGGGDPLLSTEAYIARQEDPDKPATRFEDLADALVAAGLTEVRGSVVGDGSRYDDVRYVATWPQRYRDQVVVGPLSGLGVNDGLTSFTDTEVPVNPGRPASDPPAHAASVLTDLLEERGVRIGGEPASGTAPEGAVEIAGIESPPLGDVLRQMLRYSDNMTAELLVKEIAVRTGSEGSTAAGLTSLTSSLAAAGISTEGVSLTDGSGLDLGNRATCRALAQAIEVAGPQSPVVDGLAVAGRSGTLRERMVGSAAEGRLRAKTGSLRNVAALAGLVEAANGETYTFAYITNLPEGQFVPDADAELQRELGVALASLGPIEPPAEILPNEPAAP